MFSTRGMPMTPRTASFSSSGLYVVSSLYLKSYRFGMPFFATSPPSPLSQRFPDTNTRPSVNLLMVSRQLLLHFPQRFIEISVSKFSSSPAPMMPLRCPSSALSRAISAAPYAPMMPAMSGLIASLPEISSKLRNTAGL